MSSQIKLAVLGLWPVVVYYVLYLLAWVNIIPRQVINNIREYVGILFR